ncbi:DUF6794 domain-containing protein [Phaeocystidibacter marisrubri]|uniref:DUF6794 domain-containing protein n=1 Tax=Phaeocystidibacter marisrubri TaxID=1577780 RepID=A0A6L3ZJF7_9FLAO|nr:DUF6794 domain-containing protein [Phaeocystidibacter marisrubri]KAB2818074.1 hypothetical protein F8C82_06645 [Phaeocystidibacter marisrubri]GGH72081.1 hypothetical protein GCM10011318_15690 [Phaeocystidibacter marisrubri]
MKPIHADSVDIRLITDTLNGVYIPEDLEDCFLQMDGFWNDSIKSYVKSLSELEFRVQAHLSTGTWMRNNWRLWGGSRLSLYFNNLGIYHPEDMTSIINTSYHRRLNDHDIDLEKQLKFFHDFWDPVKRDSIVAFREAQKREQQQTFKNWLHKKGIQFYDLSNSGLEDLRFNCDSTLVCKERHGDTILYTVSTHKLYADTSKIIEYNALGELGGDLYISNVNQNGIFTLYKLSQNTFYKNNDSLFYLEKYSRLPDDSANALIQWMISGEIPRTTAQQDSIHAILSANTYYQFKFIFHPDMFSKNTIRSNEDNDIIELIYQWKIDGKSIYFIEVANSDNPHNVFKVWLIDDELNIVNFEPCSPVNREAIRERDKL